MAEDGERPRLSWAPPSGPEPPGRGVRTFVVDKRAHGAGVIASERRARAPRRPHASSCLGGVDDYAVPAGEHAVGGLLHGEIVRLLRRPGILERLGARRGSGRTFACRVLRQAGTGVEGVRQAHPCIWSPITMTTLTADDGRLRRIVSLRTARSRPIDLYEMGDRAFRARRSSPPFAGERLGASGVMNCVAVDNRIAIRMSSRSS